MSNVATAGNESPVTTAAGDSVLCPMCDYDLRGQVEPRCPECGYRFDWEELRNPTRRLHPYLFEHHPRRNVRSFFRTLAGGWRPTEFWATLHPTQPSAPRRLLIYFLLVCLIGVVPTVATYGYALSQTWANRELHRSAMLAQIQSPRNFNVYSQVYPGMSPQQIVDRTMPTLTAAQVFKATWQRSNALALTRTIILVTLWPMLTLAAMMIFRISMQHARVRTIHVLRCVIYSADLIAPFNLALAVILLGAAAQSLLAATQQLHVPQFGLLFIVVGGWIVFVHRLTIALRLYLRFDHPRLTVLATQILTLLTLMLFILEVLPRLSGSR